MTPFQRPHRLRMALIALGVLLGHGVLLGALPASLHLGSHTQPTDQDTAAWVFETRTLPTPAPSTRPGPRPRPEAPRAPVRSAPAQAAALSPAAQDPAPLPPAVNTPPPTAAAVEPAEPAAIDLAQANIPAAPTPAPAPPAKQKASAAPHATPPASVRLKYDVRGTVKGFGYFVNGDLTWVQDGSSYNAKLEISHFLLGSRVQTSKGLITPEGLEPVRFGDKVRSEVAAHFDRLRHVVTYSANSPDESLAPGAQDQLSVFLQMAALLHADPERYRQGSKFQFQTIGPKHSEPWVFEVETLESLTLPGGTVMGLKLVKNPAGEYDSRAEVWLAPGLDYLPVRIRLSQSNGDVVDQQWRSTERPASTP